MIQGIFLRLICFNCHQNSLKLQVNTRWLNKECCHLKNENGIWPRFVTKPNKTVTPSTAEASSSAIMSLMVPSWVLNIPPDTSINTLYAHSPEHTCTGSRWQPLAHFLSLPLRFVPSQVPFHKSYTNVYGFSTNYTNKRSQRGEGRRVLKRDVWTWYKQGQWAKKLC